LLPELLIIESSFMKLKTLFLLLLSVSLWLSEAAYAGGTWSAVTVVGIKPCYSGYCGANGFVEVNLSAEVSEGALCGATNPAWAVIDISNSSGNAIYTLLLQSRLLGGRTLYVYGTGTCTINSTMETIGVVLL
jgi:hypothetical protein